MLDWPLELRWWGGGGEVSGYFHVLTPSFSPEVNALFLFFPHYRNAHARVICIQDCCSPQALIQSIRGQLVSNATPLKQALTQPSGPPAQCIAAKKKKQHTQTSKSRWLHKSEHGAPKERRSGSLMRIREAKGAAQKVCAVFQKRLINLSR